MLALEYTGKTVFASMPASKLRLRQGSGVSSGAAQKRRKPRCLQVPGWRARRCWLGSSSYCCCCWCCHPPSSWCYPLTSSFSSVCWAAVVQAPLCQREKRLRWERALDPYSPFPLLRSLPLPCSQSCSPRSKKGAEGTSGQEEIKATASGCPVKSLVRAGARHSPGGATMRCHFWKRQVLRQSRGLRL